MTPPDENREFTPIPNPFVTGAPVRGSSKVFFGREDHFTYVRQRLIAEKEGIVMLFAGERRSGKTSVLFQILAGRLGEEFLPIFVDMQQLASVMGDREFFARLAQLTMAAVKDDRLVPTFYDFSEGNPVITFDRLLEDIKRISPERQRLIFLVDEAETLREKVVKKELSSAVLMSIASNLENRQVSFCLTGSPGLRDSDAEGWKHLLGKADYREVTFLSRDDTLRLIQQPVEGQVAYAEGVAEAIFNLTAGHPFYTQVICTNVVDYLNQAKRNTLTMEDLAKVIRIIIANPPPQLVYAWEEQSPQEQIALSLVSEESTGPQTAVTPEALLETIKKNEYPLQHLKADGLHMVMENLYKRTVLGRTAEGAFYFQVDLFRQWIRQARSIWGLLEEKEPEKSRRSLWMVIAAGVLVLAAGLWFWRVRVAEEERAQRQQEPAGPAIGELWVESEPRDVEVLVDGQVEKRATPTMLRLKPGGRIIEVRRRDYHSWANTVEVAAGKSDTLPSIQLQRLTGKLTVTSQPPGAQVQVNGAEKDTSGLTPLQGVKLLTGEYEVTVSKERYLSQPRRVMIADATDTSLDFKLQANVGGIYLNSAPSGARIFLDDKDQGKQTPATLDDLAVGSYRVRLELQDYSPLDTTLTVSLNRTNTVSRKLVLKPALVDLNSTPPGAVIYLDGEDTGQRTPSVLSVEPGRQHQIRIEREGYEPDLREEENYLPGRKYPYSVELKPILGVVRIIKPRSGTIYIDETLQRKVPPADIPLPVGHHTLRTDNTIDTTIQVTKDDTIKISLE